MPSLSNLRTATSSTSEGGREPAVFVWGADSDSRHSHHSHDHSRDKQEPEGKVPALLPKRVAPKDYYAPAAALQKIERVEIRSTKLISGVVFYVLAVFLAHPTSRIPTLNLQQQLEKRKQQSYAAPPAPERREPDYRVLRRFSDFDKMRRHVGRFARAQLAGTCAYCDALRLFLATCYAAPVPLVKLLRVSPSARMPMLEAFVNRTVQLAIGRARGGDHARVQHQSMCAGVKAVPTLVDAFLKPQWLV